MPAIVVAAHAHIRTHTHSNFANVFRGTRMLRQQQSSDYKKQLTVETQSKMSLTEYNVLKYLKLVWTFFINRYQSN